MADEVKDNNEKKPEDAPKTEAPEKVEGEVTKPPKQKKKGMSKTAKIVIIAVVAFVGLFIALFAFVGSATKDATEASDNFLNAMQAGDAESAYNYFSTEAKAEVPEDQFMVVVAQIGPILNTEESRTSASIEASTDSASTASVEYEIDGTDGNTYVIGINLVKEDGEWKVLNFDSDLR